MTGRLERILRDGTFAVTAEIVPPRSADPEAVREQARAIAGHVDAANVTDSPTSAAHMSPVAGSALVAAEGLEPVIQLTTRDRNRLALTGDLLGAWAVGARNVLCLTGDPVKVGEDPAATQVRDLTVLDLVRLAVRLREEGRSLTGQEIDPPPRYLVGVADVPLEPGYDPGRLDQKLDAGASFIQTQIVYDAAAFADWAENARARGVFDRASVLVGLAPPRSEGSLRFMREHLPGVVVPDAVVERLREADDPAAEGVKLTVEILDAARRIDGIAGVHLMGLGRGDAVRRVVEDAGLLPRPG
ncbi:MAG: methylenetetrahydrofolate reductase [Actinomycetota bacterium]|nr:methylenetetrahydrofolate reductase [Actinomycetota bacterium]